MAQFGIEYQTSIPQSMIEEIIAMSGEFNLDTSLVIDPTTKQEGELSRRNSLSGFISTDHWIGPFIWYYIQKANRKNFLYDITSFDTELLQYTVYKEGMYYGWHPDQHLYTQFTPDVTPSSKVNEGNIHAIINAEYVRKLSFSLQLSDPSEYTGGELQFLDAGVLYTAPQEKGKLIIFDSRTLHRVRKVKSGVRKSLVGWVVGPRWK